MNVETPGLNNDGVIICIVGTISPERYSIQRYLFNYYQISLLEADFN